MKWNLMFWDTRNNLTYRPFDTVQHTTFAVTIEIWMRMHASVPATSSIIRAKLYIDWIAGFDLQNCGANSHGKTAMGLSLGVGTLLCRRLAVRKIMCSLATTIIRWANSGSESTCRRENFLLVKSTRGRALWLDQSLFRIDPQCRSDLSNKIAEDALHPCHLSWSIGMTAAFRAIIRLNVSDVITLLQLHSAGRTAPCQMCRLYSSRLNWT